MKTTFNKGYLKILLVILLFSQGCTVQYQAYMGILDKVEKYVSGGGDINPGIQKSGGLPYW